MADNEEGNEKRGELSSADRKALCFMMTVQLKDGVLPHGMFKACAQNFPVAPKAVSRACKECKERVDECKSMLDNGIGDENNNNNNTNNGALPDCLFAAKRLNCGRKKKWDREEWLADQVKETPLKSRRTHRCLEPAINVPRAALHRMLKKEDALRRATSSLKPKLTLANKLWRAQCAISQTKQRPQASRADFFDSSRSRFGRPT